MKLAAGVFVGSAVGRVGAMASPVGSGSGMNRTPGGGGDAGTPETATPARPRAGTKEPPWELVAPLVQGSDLGHGWSLSDLSGLVAGSVVATLEHLDARRERVHICRRAGEPRGIVSTSGCDLLIMNSGNSDRPTDEGLAQAVARLGLAIHESERTGVAAGTVATLISHDERLTRYSSEDGGSLR